MFRQWQLVNIHPLEARRDECKGQENSHHMSRGQLQDAISGVAIIDDTNT